MASYIARSISKAHAEPRCLWRGRICGEEFKATASVNFRFVRRDRRRLDVQSRRRTRRNRRCHLRRPSLTLVTQTPVCAIGQIFAVCVPFAGLVVVALAGRCAATVSISPRTRAAHTGTWSRPPHRDRRTPHGLGRSRRGARGIRTGCRARSWLVGRSWIIWIQLIQVIPFPIRGNSKRSECVGLHLCVGLPLYIVPRCASTCSFSR